MPKSDRNISYLKSKNKDLMIGKQDLEMELHDSRQSFEELKIKSDKLELEKRSFSQKQGTTERNLEISRSQILKLTKQLRCAETENSQYLNRMKKIENDLAVKLKNKKVKMIEFLENSFDALNP